MRLYAGWEGESTDSLFFLHGHSSDKTTFFSAHDQWRTGEEHDISSSVSRSFRWWLLTKGRRRCDVIRFSLMLMMHIEVSGQVRSMSEPNIMPIHLIHVEIFHSTVYMWTRCEIHVIVDIFQSELTDACRVNNTMFMQGLFTVWYSL